MGSDLKKAIKSLFGKGSPIMIERKKNQITTEISVTVKNEKSSTTEKDLHYGPLDISCDSSTINKIIQLAISRFSLEENGEAPSIIVKTKTIWQ